MNDQSKEQFHKPVGEVVHASTTEFVAQCYKLYASPPLGSLVKCEVDGPIYGVVGEVNTQSIAVGRSPMVMGDEDERGDDVYRSNPQLSKLLSTEFRCVVVGFGSDGQIHRYVAPQPSKIHFPVYVCDSLEIVDFSSSLDFLSLLLNTSFGSSDDTIASFLRIASHSYPEPDDFMVAAGKELAMLLGDQLQRLNGILKRLSR